MRRLCLSMLLAGSLLFAVSPAQADPAAVVDSVRAVFEHQATDDGSDGDAIWATTLGRT